MTVAVLVVRPPADAPATESLAETTPLSSDEAADLVAAAYRDAAAAVAESSMELLVNYPPADDSSVADPQSALGAVLADVPDLDARYEVQVGSTFAARVGNTVTHLLDAEDENSVVVLTGDAPLMGRADLDEVAMRLRRDEVVLGPAGDGRTYAAGFRAPVDFTGAYDPPELVTLARRASDADLGVNFLPQGVRVGRGADLRTLLAEVEARRATDRPVPTHTTAALDALGLRLDAEEGRAVLARD